MFYGNQDLFSVSVSKIAWSAPSHHPTQCWNIVNSTHRNIFQWNRKQNACIFIQENVLENVVCNMVAIWSRPQRAKLIHRRSSKRFFANSMASRESQNGFILWRHHAKLTKQMIHKPYMHYSRRRKMGTLVVNDIYSHSSHCLSLTQKLGWRKWINERHINVGVVKLQ